MGAVRRTDRNGDWWIDFRYRGKRVRKRSPVQSKRGAEAFERTLRNELLADDEAGRNPFGGPAPTLEEFAKKWMQDYVAARNRASVQSSKAMILEKHLLPRFGKMRIDRIDTEAIDALAAAKMRGGLRPKSVNNILSVLHTMLTTAADWKLLRTVPRHAWLRVPEPRFRVLTESEQQALVAAAPEGLWRAFLVFFLHTGVRFGEAAALQWGDLALDRETPVVRICRGGARGEPGDTKTGSHRELPVTTDVIDHLRRLPRDSELVFPRPDGGMMDPASKTSYLRRFCAWAGVQPFGWHVFRHTYATAMAVAGTPIHVLQRLLGHTTIKMTMRYVHVDAATLAATASVVREALPIPQGLGRPVVTGPIPRPPDSPERPGTPPLHAQTALSGRLALGAGNGNRTA